MNSLSFKIGLRYTFSRKQSHLVAFISRVSTAGMVLAVSVLITVMSVMNGFDKALREEILAIMPHATLGGLEEVADWQEPLKIVQDHPKVKNAAPFSQEAVLLQSGKHIKPALVFGMDKDYESPDSAISKLLGLDKLKALEQGAVVILGDNLAEKLGVVEGDSLKILLPDPENRSVPEVSYFKVIGFLQSHTELDEKLVVMHRKMLASIRHQHPESVDGLRLTLYDLFEARSVSMELTGYTGMYNVKDWSRTHGNLYHAVQMSRKMVLIMVFIIIAVAAFNVVSTLVLAVNDKARDIAILRTMGCSRKQVMMIFTAQGLMIGIVGVSIGVLAGVLLSLSVGDLVTWIEQVSGHQFLKTEVYPIDRLPSDIHAVDVTVVSVISILLSLMATLLPAWQAGRIAPAKALRYE